MFSKLPDKNDNFLLYYFLLIEFFNDKIQSEDLAFATSFTFFLKFSVVIRILTDLKHKS